MHSRCSNGALARELRNTTAVTSVNGVACAQAGVGSDDGVSRSPQRNGGSAIVDVSLKRPAGFFLIKV
jgi:hypothetical protein